MNKINLKFIYHLGNNYYIYNNIYQKRGVRMFGLGIPELIIILFI